MAKNECVFCKIIGKELPATIIHETDDVIAIKDIAPKAPVHYLIIPKKHIKDVQSLASDDLNLVGKLYHMAQQLAQRLSGSKAFRLITNNGADAGQSVHHLHLHFLSGKKMLDF